MQEVITTSILEIGLIIWSCWIVWVTPEMWRVMVLGQEPTMGGKPEVIR